MQNFGEITKRIIVFLNKTCFQLFQNIASRSCFFGTEIT